MKAPDAKFVEFSVLQIVASEIIKLKTVEVDDKKAVTVLNLALMEDQITPFFLSDKAHFFGWLESNCLNAHYRLAIQPFN